MNVCVDVGNSTIGIGVFQDNNLIKRWIFNTDTRLTSDEFLLLLKNQFNDSNLSFAKEDKLIFSSVVPSINVPLLTALKELIPVEPLLIGPGCKTGLAIKVDNPLEIGNDLIAD